MKGMRWTDLPRLVSEEPSEGMDPQALSGVSNRAVVYWQQQRPQHHFSKPAEKPSKSRGYRPAVEKRKAQHSHIMSLG